MNIANLKTCARCTDCTTSATGKLTCALSGGLPIERHANGDGCPKGLFPPMAAGEIPADWDPKDYAKDSGGSEGCNCGE